MLKISAGGKNGKADFCDGVARRDFIRIGAMGIGGLTMANLLEAEAKYGIGSSHKAVINLFLPGGPPHQDMWDLKMDAPREIRGEFKPISTNVPGTQICELFPRMAKMMDKFTVIRSIVGATGAHDADQCMTGRTKKNEPPGGWPSIGSILSKLEGPTNPDTPPFLGLCPKTGEIRWSDPGKAGFLGPAHAAFRPSAEGKEDMTLNGITLQRLQDRKALLRSFDQFRRNLDSSGLMEGMDAYNQQAYGILTSGKLANALDLEQEDVKLRDRYGRARPSTWPTGRPSCSTTFARTPPRRGRGALRLTFVQSLGLARRQLQACPGGLPDARSGRHRARRGFAQPRTREGCGRVCWVNLAARRPSTRMRVATTGRASPPRCSPVVA